MRLNTNAIVSSSMSLNAVNVLIKSHQVYILHKCWLENTQIITFCCHILGKISVSFNGRYLNCVSLIFIIRPCVMYNTISLFKFILR